MTIKTFVGAASLLALASCGVVGPDFMKPKINMAESFAFAPHSALRQAAQDDWWKAFRAPVLNSLMERGLRQNLSVQAAQARILEAEYLLQAAGPNSQISGDITLSALGVKTEGVAGDTSLRGSSSPSFVIDLFGGAKRQREQSGANLMAAVFNKASARLAIQLAIVSAYLDLRYFQQTLAIQQRAVANKREIVNNINLRANVGDATRVEVRRAEAELDLATAQLPDYIAGQRVAVLALAALLAEPGATINAELRKGGTQPVPRNGVHTGVPSELLRNRPDIRSAEARLAAAVAEVGVLEAQLYPSLRLGGTVTAATTSSVSFGPSLTLPIFDRPTRLARRNAAAARVEQAEIDWRQTVVDALEEVQTALVRLDQADDRMSALRKAEVTYRDAQNLSEEAFRLGSVTLLDLLSTQDSLTSTQLQLASARRSYALSWAQVNVGIGQGWYAEAPLSHTAAIQ
ncbi:efflux transporter outer membrane subunit [Pseudooceanicola sp. C21-150M6]|uniref:efflux transporter outer membrane subunit n=1 Tax=Pseudooceanicola sp. C21-150M6 TaxID=3434355 RepID=UPI003D7F2772